MLGYASPSNNPNNFSSNAVKYGLFNSPKIFKTARPADSISGEYNREMRKHISLIWVNEKRCGEESQVSGLCPLT